MASKPIGDTPKSTSATNTAKKRVSFNDAVKRVLFQVSLSDADQSDLSSEDGLEIRGRHRQCTKKLKRSTKSEDDVDWTPESTKSKVKKTKKAKKPVVAKKKEIDFTYNPNRRVVYSPSPPPKHIKTIEEGFEEYRNSKAYAWVVSQNYKQLLYMGRDYPQGYDYFRSRCYNAFKKNKDIQDPKEIEALIQRGEFVVGEINALYYLKKYRTLKRRYYSSEEEQDKFRNLMVNLEKFESTDPKSN